MGYASISGIERRSPYSPTLTELKKMFTLPCGWWTIFHHVFSTDKTLIAFGYSMAISVSDIQAHYIHWFHQFKPSNLTTAMPRALYQTILIPFVFHWYGKRFIWKGCIVNHCNFNLFNFKVNTYLPDISSSSALSYTSYVHTTTLFLNTLIWGTLGPCIWWIFSR